MRINVGDGMTVDTSEVDALFNKMGLSQADMLAIEKPGSLTIINTQRMLVPVDTGNLKLSINTQIQNSSALEVVSHTGPNTVYAAAVEFGRPDLPNYPIQPYVRPSGMVAGAKAVIKAIEAAAKILLRRKVG